MRRFGTVAVSVLLGAGAWMASGRAAAQEPKGDLDPIRLRLVPSEAAVVPYQDGDSVYPPPFEVEEGRPSGDRVRRALVRAREAIKEADEAADDDEDARPLVEAAKRIFNVARDLAVAGENGDALRLARVATTLAETPALLKVIASGEVVPEAVEMFEFQPDEEKPDVEEGVFALKGLKVGPLRLEIRGIGEHRGEAGAEGEAEADDAGPVVGVGLAVGQDEEGSFGVLEVVPEGPAAEEGTIRKGDQLVGVATDDGVESFEGKELVDVVRQIRGEAGTEVRLVVRHKGEEETTVVTLKRQKLTLPEPAGNDEDERPDGGDEE